MTADLNTLMSQHRSRLLGVGISILRNRADAEECVQEAYLSAFRFSAQCRDLEPATWLKKILVNQCFNLMRRKGRKVVYLDDWTAFLAPVYPHFEEWIDRETIGQALRAQLQKMPRILCDAVLLYDIEGLSPAESAARLGITTSAFKTRQFRGRRELRVRMRRYAARA